MTSSINFDKLYNELIFIPLGGSGEIGMNLNLYHYNGKWIIVDLGIGFADPDLPGINIIVPDINFILQKIKNNISAIILTHAHEDHIGAIQYLWPEIECPIYATKFTSLIVMSKCKEYGLADKIRLIEIKSHQSFNLEDFTITFIPITHSIPEMHGLLIETTKGKIFHTGDWKFDNEPIVGEKVDYNTLKQIGQSGVLALIGDSTNIFLKEHSGSEGKLGKNLEKLLYQSNNLIIVTTFASNIARLVSLTQAAKKVGRKVILQGRSLQKMYRAAKESGYFKESVIVDEKRIKNFQPNEILIICTGCQGENLAVMTKIIDKKHRYISLKQDDLVIFSSKIIPGNEKKIYSLFNKLAEMKVNVLSENNEFVHVSGHPSSLEVKKMFELIKPKIAIPVHGEAIHLNEHCKVAQELGITQTFSVRNGDVIIINDTDSRKIGKVEAGYNMIDGNLILHEKNQIIEDRQVLRDSGVIFIALVVNQKRKDIKNLHILTPGLLELTLDNDILRTIKNNILKMCKTLPLLDENITKKRIQLSVKKYIKKTLNKSPLIQCTISII